MTDPTYKPSAFYFRRELRATKTREEAVEIGLRVVLELEQLKAWVREQGLFPPKVFAPISEISDKGWQTEQQD